MKIRSFLFLVLFTLSTFSYSAPQVYKHYELLSEEYTFSLGLTKVSIDTHGHAWVGSQQGLNHYNGGEVQLYKADPTNPFSLSNNWVTEVHAQGDTVWVGTRNGLNRLDLQTKRFYEIDIEPSRSLMKKNVSALHVNQSGELWVSFFEEGLFYLDELTNQLIAVEMPNTIEGVSTRAITKIWQDEHNNLWLVVGGDYSEIMPSGILGGLIRWNPALQTGQAWSSANTPISSDFVGSLLFDDEKKWVLTTSDGLWTLNDDNELIRESIPEGMHNSILRDIVKDQQGNLWVSTWGNGVWVFQQAQQQWEHLVEHPEVSNSLMSNEITHLHVDELNNVWVIDKFNVSVFHALSQLVYNLPNAANDNNLLNSTEVRSIYPTAADRIWIANSSGGVALFDSISRTLKKFPLPVDARQPSAARGVMEDDTKIWVATDKGVYTLDEATAQWSLIELLPNQGPIHTNSFFKDNQQRIWVGTSGKGVFVLNEHGEVLQHYYKEAAVDATLFNTAALFLQDSLERIWIGSIDGGVARVNADLTQWTYWAPSLDEPYFIDNNLIRGMIEENGHIWVRTGSSDYRFMGDDSKPNFKPYIAPEDWDDAYLNARRFLFQDGIMLTDQKTLLLHDKPYGSQRASVIGGYVYKDNMIFRGGNEGLDYWVRVDEMPNSYSPLSVELTDFTLFNTRVAPDEEGVLTKTLSYSDKITLDYAQDVIGLSFAAPGVKDEEQIRYRYRLLGFTDNWLYTTHDQRQATFTRLPPGRYEFEVSAAYSHSLQWSDPMRVEIEVLPPWWMTWWFRSVVILALLLAVISFFRWRILAEKKIQKQLQQLVDERTHDLVEKQNQLILQEKMASLGRMVNGVAHEINTPLGGVLTLSSHMQNNLSKLSAALESKTLKQAQLQQFCTEFDESLCLLHVNAQKAAELVKSFKQVAVEQKGEKLQTINIASYLNKMVATLKPQLDEHQCQFTLLCSDELTWTTYAGSLAQIFTNLCLNSLDHAFAETKEPQITLTVTEQAHHWAFEFKDNGQGVDADTLKQLFDPFYTTKRFQGFIGLGAHVVYNIVSTKFKGEIAAYSDEQSGLRFILHLPKQIANDV